VVEKILKTTVDAIKYFLEVDDVTKAANKYNGT